MPTLLPLQSPLAVAESVVVSLMVCGLCLSLLVHLLGRDRPGLHLALPVGFCFLLRMAAAAVVQLTPFASTLRGGDETDFFATAQQLALQPLFSHGVLNSLTSSLYIFLPQSQVRALGSSMFTVRISEVAISAAAIALLATSVHDLAGPRAAHWAALLMAIEPGTALFASLIHKESLMYLAEAMAIYGCTQVWTKHRLMRVWPAVVGALIATATRPYAGWFLAVGIAACLLHASVRPGWASPRQARLLTAVLLIGAIAASPLAWHATSTASLQRLQVSQNANSAGGSALSLESVNYSSRAGIILNLPQRAFDLMLRPFPWQLGDLSQQLGVLGELVTLLALAFVIPRAWRARGVFWARSGPLVYIGGFTLWAYGLSIGNAGTGFRYRTHVLLILFALACVLGDGAPSSATPAPVAESDASDSGRGLIAV